MDDRWMMWPESLLKFTAGGSKTNVVALAAADASAASAAAAACTGCI